MNGQHGIYSRTRPGARFHKGSSTRDAVAVGWLRLAICYGDSLACMADEAMPRFGRYPSGNVRSNGGSLARLVCSVRMQSPRTFLMWLLLSVMSGSLQLIAMRSEHNRTLTQFERT